MFRKTSKRIISIITALSFMLSGALFAAPLDFAKGSALRPASFALANALERFKLAHSDDPELILEAKALTAMGMDPYGEKGQASIAVYLKYRDMKRREAANTPLPTDDPKIYPAGKFVPECFLSDSDRKNYLGVVDYDSNIRGIGEYGDCAKDIEFVELVLEGGLGTNLTRGRYVEEMHNRLDLASKATDLSLIFPVPQRNNAMFTASVAEVKLLNLIKRIETHATGKRTILRPLVSIGDIDASRPSYEALFNEKPYLEDVMRGVEEPRTYGQVLAELGVEIRWWPSDIYPGVEPGTTKPVPAKANLSHGEFGIRKCVELLDESTVTTPRITVFYNGDNTNARPDGRIAGWMDLENIPMAILTTRRTNSDAKGGIVGIIEVPDGKGGITKIPAMLELRSAINNGQADLFKKIGLDVPHAENENIGIAGEQGFNTNTIYINDKLMSPILKELEDIIGREAVLYIAAPDPIPTTKFLDKDKKQPFTNVEGPIGTSLINLNNFFTTIDSNNEYTLEQKAQIKNILAKRNMKRLLYMVNAPRDWTPVKFAVDFWLQSCTNFYKLDPGKWNLIATQGFGYPLPMMELIGPPEDDKYYLDVWNVISALGLHAEVKGLKHLIVKGKIYLQEIKGTDTPNGRCLIAESGPELMLEGNVAIIDNSKNGFHLSSLLSTHDREGKIYLKNRKIIIDAFGNISDEPWDGERDGLLPEPLDTEIKKLNLSESVLLDKDAAYNVIKELVVERTGEAFWNYIVDRCDWPYWPSPVEADRSPAARNSYLWVKHKTEELLSLSQLLQEAIFNKKQKAFAFLDPYETNEALKGRVLTSVCLSFADHGARLGQFLPNDLPRISQFVLNDVVNVREFYKNVPNGFPNLYLSIRNLGTQTHTAHYTQDDIIDRCKNANSDAAVYLVTRDKDTAVKLIPLEAMYEDVSKTAEQVIKAMKDMQLGENIDIKKIERILRSHVHIGVAPLVPDDRRIPRLAHQCAALMKLEQAALRNPHDKIVFVGLPYPVPQTKHEAVMDLAVMVPEASREAATAQEDEHITKMNSGSIYTTTDPWGFHVGHSTNLLVYELKANDANPVRKMFDIMQYYLNSNAIVYVDSVNKDGSVVLMPITQGNFKIYKATQLIRQALYKIGRSDITAASVENLLVKHEHFNIETDQEYEAMARRIVLSVDLISVASADNNDRHVLVYNVNSEVTEVLVCSAQRFPNAAISEEGFVLSFLRDRGVRLANNPWAIELFANAKQFGSLAVFEFQKPDPNGESGEVANIGDLQFLIDYYLEQPGVCVYTADPEASKPILLEASKAVEAVEAPNRDSRQAQEALGSAA